LVEDDKSTVKSLKICFEIYHTDSTISSTDRGLEALRMLKKYDYDVVIIDLGLPDIDGIVVLEELRKFSSIPAIIFSARHSLEVIARATELGANDYVAKPFDYKLLLKRIRNVVERSTAKL
jgi:DNA-binding response OmpR family regulator